MRNWLIEARKKAGFPQEYVAHRAGISQQHYSFIESGERRPSPEVAKRIAHFLGFDWTKFFEDSQQQDSN